MCLVSNLSTLMGKKRYSIEDVHQLTGLSRSTISSLYNNKASRIDFATAEKLCKLFECNIGDIFCISSDAVDKQQEEKG